MSTERKISYILRGLHHIASTLYMHNPKTMSSCNTANFKPYTDPGPFRSLIFFNDNVSSTLLTMDGWRSGGVATRLSRIYEYLGYIYVLDSLRDAKFLTKLEYQNGYWKLPIPEAEIK